VYGTPAPPRIAEEIPLDTDPNRLITGAERARMPPGGATPAAARKREREDPGRLTADLRSETEKGAAEVKAKAADEEDSRMRAPALRKNFPINVRSRLSGEPSPAALFPRGHATRRYATHFTPPKTVYKGF
jgi:hypothetical protein